MIFDFTAPLDESTPNWPGDPQPHITQVSTVAEEGIAKKELTFHSHFSTHIDAPAHMLEGGKTLSDYPIETFIGSALVLDVRNQSEIDTSLEQVQENDIVLFLTGHSNNMHKPTYFTENPVLSPRIAQELVRKKVKIVGLDAPTPDNEPYTLHKLFFAHNILIIENLVHLNKVAGKRFMCYALPLNVKDGDGAPCRVIGVLEK